MSSHLLAFTIGPAHQGLQEFIGAARRCHDLWFGSWLIADLCKAAARGVSSEIGGYESLIFPAPDTAEELSSTSRLTVANKIVTHVPDGIDPRRVAEAARLALDQRLGVLTAATLGKVGKGDPRRPSHLDLSLAKDQIGELIETNWAAVPMADDADFGDARATLDRLIVARRALHAWKQPAWRSEDGSRKSSLDGLRDSVLREGLYDGSVNPTDRRHWYDIHGHERLCGVGLLKRFGRLALREEEPEIVRAIPSTNHLAALPTLRGLDLLARNDCEVAKQWTEYRDTLVRVGIETAFSVDAPPELRSTLLGAFDGGVLFSGRVQEALLDINADPVTRQRVEQARSKLLRRARFDDPIPYYGILVADGDSMGKLVKAQRHGSEQRSLSRALSVFAQSVAQSVPQYEGVLIYAGGDDVLALLPLHRALEAASQIALAFRTALSPWDEHKPSISAGLAVVHAWSPLEQGLRAARDAERLAKQQEGKGAIAIAVHKRSGEAVTARGTFGLFVDELQRLVRLQMKNQLPGTLIQELVGLQTLQRDIDNPDARKGITAIQVAETRRILNRKDVDETLRDELRRRVEQGWIAPVDLGQSMAVARVFALSKLAAKGGDRGSLDD